MDTHLTGQAPTAAEIAAIETALAAAGGLLTDPPDWAGHAAHGGAALRAQRHLLLPLLQAIQARVGWISPGALSYLGERLAIPPAEAYGVASFYGLLATRPQPPRVLHVCEDLACALAGAASIAQALTQQVGPPGEPDATGSFTWRPSPCLGHCDRAPAALSIEAGERPVARTLAPLTPAAAVAVARGEPVAAPSPAPLPQAGDPSLRLLRRVGRVEPTNLVAYRAHGGYTALARALASGPAAVIAAVQESGLIGRGGAAFPTGRKWAAVAAAPVQPHYLIANADESEPGTFKDRVLLEEDPFAVIEAMTIAAYATGCSQGFLYVRGEYPLAAERLQQALAAARAAGLLGRDILGQGFDFDIVLRQGAGAYICGEETALFNSIEGYRGEPRNKPPFPTERGLFGKPTVVNNIETLVNVLEIVERGAAAFAAGSPADSTGTKLFCLSGHVARPGLYEVPFGTTLHDLLARAGGVRAGRALQAILLGGAAGTFLTPAQLDTPLTLAGTRAIGASLGSGVVMVFDETADLGAAVRRIAAFFREESCGQCVPCRIGTVRQEEAVVRLLAGQPHGGRAAELARLQDLAQVMRDASICGLGQTASAAILSAFLQFPLGTGPEVLP